MCPTLRIAGRLNSIETGSEDHNCEIPMGDVRLNSQRFVRKSQMKGPALWSGDFKKTSEKAREQNHFTLESMQVSQCLMGMMEEAKASSDNISPDVWKGRFAPVWDKLNMSEALRCSPAKWLSSWMASTKGVQRWIARSCRSCTKTASAQGRQSFR